MQITKIETTKKLNSFDVQEHILKTSKQKYDITDRELCGLPNDTKVYSSCGYMFVRSSVPEMHDELVHKQSKCEELITQMNERKEYLVKKLKEQEDSLRDLVQQKKK